MRRFTLASCLAAAMAIASPAYTQTQASGDVSGTRAIPPAPVEWIQGVSELTAAVAGMYGDEGPQIAAALDQMARGLAAWDRDIQRREARLGSAQAEASPRALFDMHVALATTYIARGRLSEAAQQLELASGLEPRRADLHVRRGLVLEAASRAAEAGDAFRAGWAAAPGDPLAAYHVFRHASAAGNTKDAQRGRDVLSLAYRRLLQDAPRAKASPFIGLPPLYENDAGTPVLPPALYSRSFASLAKGDYEEAIAEFRNAAAADPLVADPATRSPSIAKVISALRQERPIETRALLDEAAAAPAAPEARRVLGMIYWVDSQDDKSIEQLEIAIRENPRDERSRLVLARVLTSAARDLDAQRVLQETIRVLPDSVLAHWWLGTNHERLNQFADARREFELAATGAVAGHSQLHASIGRLAADAADFAAASDAFARAVTARPNDAALRRSLAGTLLPQDRTDEAFVELVAALLIDPLDAGAHGGIGQIFLNAGRLDEAVTAFRRALALSPDLTDARYGLATALMRSGDTDAAAHELARVEQAQRQILAGRRRDMTLDVLKEEAAALAGAGRLDEAIERLEVAANLQSRDSGFGIRNSEPPIRNPPIAADPEIYRRLAELYAKAGRTEDASRAASMYEKARQGKPAGGASR